MTLQTSWLLAAVLFVAAPAVAQERQPFQQGAVGIEGAVAPLIETWNLNGHREPMIEMNAAFWGAVSDRFNLGIEFRHAFVFQHTPGAFVQGISPLLRWRFADTTVWDWFVEAGPGVSWSDLDTPPRGTRFNYLFQSGVGAMRRLARSQQLVLAYRFLHLSNNHREGRERNPDLEMMGIYLGWAVSF
ncbi:MAG TPA: acyloxyacyl hydrolase [Vicinamibacterales bacterium]|nr:acyloxyacyl hydrolase [Vicinamibacterales bacterium]